jgi:hypothetical protein
LVNQCGQRAAEGLEKIFGQEHPHVFTLWYRISVKFRSESRQRLLTMLNCLRKAARSIEATSSLGSRRHIKNLSWQLNLILRAEGPSDETLAVTNELRRAIALSKEIGTREKKIEETTCLFALFYIHKKRCSAQPTRYNP